MPFPYLASPSFTFPTYLVPSLPFRDRKSSTDSTTSTTSTFSTTSTASNSTSKPYLTSRISHLRCTKCSADLALTTQIISKGFTGRHGRAYLVAPSDTTPPTPSQPSPITTTSTLPNTITHKSVPRQLVTGAHTVSDISCAHCGSVLGWKYVAAEEEAQRYKVGKYILETRKVCRSAGWEGEGAFGREDGGLGGYLDGVEGGGTEFDSQDEDECEDLFLGVWTPQLARRRRRAKMLRKGSE